MREKDKIRNLKSGSSLASEFTRIYRDHFDRLYFFALTFTKSDDAAKDVVSEVFLNLWKNKATLSGIKQLESYLYISIKNQAIQMLSRDLRNRDSLDFEREVKVIDKIDPEELLLEKELMQEIEKAVATLPDQCRLIFEMAKNKQMKYKEIASELGITVSTVRMQLIKASGIIKETIKKKYDDGEGSGAIQLGMINLLVLTFISI